MKTYKLYQIDAFTKEKFHGNPAGVVPYADGLTEEMMQRIARELNNSETAFIFSTKEPEKYDVEVRFFTPTAEVPLCGHATVAAHYVRAIEGLATSGTVLQKTKAGILPVDITCEENDYAITMTQATPMVGEPFDEKQVMAIVNALKIERAELREDCPITIAATGYPKIMVGIKSQEKLHMLQPDMEALTRISKEVGCNGYYVFTLSPEEKVLVHGRMFAPISGILEDPVTGNANGPLGAYLVHYGLCKYLQNEDYFDFEIKQGEAMKREGGMKVHVQKVEGKPHFVQITGRAVTIFQTEIQIEA